MQNSVQNMHTVNVNKTDMTHSHNYTFSIDLHNTFALEPMNFLDKIFLWNIPQN